VAVHRVPEFVGDPIPNRPALTPPDEHGHILLLLSAT
jgi:hypothetical protein